MGRKRTYGCGNFLKCSEIHGLVVVEYMSKGKYL